MTGPWTHEWDGETPVSVFAMAEQLATAWPEDVGTAEIERRAEQWAANRAADAAEVGRTLGSDDPGGVGQFY